ncbi:PIR protein [Plasmodium vivax]|nr:PIR protein [Plasmodium vivax]
MEKTTYNFVSLFPEYKTKMDAYIKNPPKEYESSCQGITENHLSNNDISIKNSCLIVMAYLNDIRTTYYNRDIVSHCKYVYYWLYEFLLIRLGNDKNVLQYYNDILNKHNEQHAPSICVGTVEEFDKEKYGKINALYNVYEKYYSYTKKIQSCTSHLCTCGYECIKDYKTNIQKCTDPSNYEFCNELENFRTIYNTHIASGNSCDNMPDYLPPFLIIHISHIILIPITILLAISFILFLLYKYTPFGSRLCPLKKKMTQIRCNINEEIHQLNSTQEGSQKNMKNRSYHIAYNSV